MPSTSGAGHDTKRPRIRQALVALAIVGVTIVACGLGWWSLRTSAGDPDRTETLALLASLSRVRTAIVPIAQDYTSANQSAPIDVSAYRDRIEAAHAAVTAVNDVSVESTEGLAARDDIITGGEAILQGLSTALDALQSDDASAATEAGAQVDEGMSLLDAAEDSLTSKARSRGWTP